MCPDGVSGVGPNTQNLIYNNIPNPFTGSGCSFDAGLDQSLFNFGNYSSMYGYGYGPGSETMRMDMKTYLDYDKERQIQKARNDSEIQSKLKYIDTARNAEEDVVTTAAANVASLARQGNYDQIYKASKNKDNTINLSAWQKLENAERDKLKRAHPDDIGYEPSPEEIKAAALADLEPFDYLKTLAKGNSQVMDGALDGILCIGDRYKSRMSAADCMHEVTGQGPTESEKAQRSLGTWVSRIVTCAAALVLAPLLLKGTFKAIDGERKLVAWSFGKSAGDLFPGLKPVPVI